MISIPIVEVRRTRQHVQYTEVVCEDRMSRSAQCAKAFVALTRGSPKEEFWALYLDATTRPIAAHMVSRGIVSASLVHPREVFVPALSLNASAIVIGHNHPSGDCEPSREDHSITHRLIEAGEILGIKIVDHCVVCDDGSYVSFLERDYI
jgi:DNA repair protein RadC